MARILVIDDDITLLRAEAAALRYAGHEVTAAVDGREGLRCIENQHFDLVITDIVMPDKEGLETIQELRAMHPSQRILAVSGGGRIDAENYLIIAQALGAVAVLAKPYVLEEFLTVVHRVLAD